MTGFVCTSITNICPVEVDETAEPRLWNQQANNISAKCFQLFRRRLAVRLITKCLQTHDTLAEDEAVAAVKPPHLVLIDIRESASARVPIFPL